MKRKEVWLILTGLISTLIILSGIAFLIHGNPLKGISIPPSNINTATPLSLNQVTDCGGKGSGILTIQIGESVILFGDNATITHHPNGKSITIPLSTNIIGYIQFYESGTLNIPMKINPKSICKIINGNKDFANEQLNLALQQNKKITQIIYWGEKNESLQISSLSEVKARKVNIANYKIEWLIKGG